MIVEVFFSLFPSARVLHELYILFNVYALKLILTYKFEN